jgi:acetyl esterase
LIYFHGGGWVLGDLRTHDPFCRQLARATDAAVLAVDYRLAPEHPFPAAALDCLDAANWVAGHLAELGLPAMPLFVGGDSAGGNLAAIVARQADADCTSRLRGQLLIYPVTRHYLPHTASYIENATGYGLTRALMEWFWDTYLGTADAASVADLPRLAAPLDANLPESVAPALVITAGLDPLRDEGADYAEKLRQAGTACQHELFETAMHGFVCSEGPTRDHRQAMILINQWMNQQCT